MHHNAVGILKRNSQAAKENLAANETLEEIFQKKGINIELVK